MAVHESSLVAPAPSSAVVTIRSRPVRISNVAHARHATHTRNGLEVTFIGLLACVRAARFSRGLCESHGLRIPGTARRCKSSRRISLLPRRLAAGWNSPVLSDPAGAGNSLDCLGRLWLE